MKFKRKYYKKILVIGSPGAGKSIFARKLRDITGLPLYHLDLFWHKPDRTTVTREEFDVRLKELLIEDRWIIDGNYQRTLPVRLNACDQVFLLDFPLEVCLAGAELRVGKQREDLPWLESELDEDFRQWIIDFPKKQLPQIYQLLERCDSNVVIFKSRIEAQNYLRMLNASSN